MTKKLILYAKDIIICILVVAFIFSIFRGYNTQRKLEQCMDQLEHYRIEFAAAQNRERDIINSINRTDEILDRTIYSVEDLRTILRDIEAEYNYMRNRLCDNDDNSDSRGNGNICSN